MAFAVPFLADAGDDGIDLDLTVPDIARASHDRSVAYATGAAGDVYLCHPFLVHAANRPHRGTAPRIIAQPGVLVMEPFPLTNRADAYPVEATIIDARVVDRDDGGMTWSAPDVERGRRTDMACAEREMLQDWLRLRRVFLLRKCAGLTAVQLMTASVEPSHLTLLGLLRHMAEVERTWFRQKFQHEDLPELYCNMEHPHGDLDLAGDADAEADYMTFLAETAKCDASVAGRGLDEVADDAKAPTGKVSLRWVYLHVLEEYAQHTGHADLIRERIDGATGA